MIVLHFSELDSDLSLFPDKSLLFITILPASWGQRKSQEDWRRIRFLLLSFEQQFPSFVEDVTLGEDERVQQKQRESKQKQVLSNHVQQTGIHNITLELLQETCNHAVQYQSSAEIK